MNEMAGGFGPETDGAAETPGAATHLDVLIVGAGISGIGAGWHLRKLRPDTRFAMLEAQDGFGGTWLTHRFPGARSDSDLFTFGYGFKPWIGPPIATRAEILSYLAEVIEEADLGPAILYGHRVLSAAWDTAEARWTVTAERLEDGARRVFTAGFLWMCQGYYRHDRPYVPDWPGMADFKGRIVHPQAWPEDLDVAGQRVVVIGSGATAATLVPALAEEAGSVTMLQRTPTFFIAQRNANELADTLRALDVDPVWIHEIIRRKVEADQAEFVRRTREEPDAVRADLIAGVKAYLGDAVPVEPHFAPPYRPWSQRVAYVPDGDLFRALAAGRAEVVTDRIARFTEAGILLESGRELEADVIATATGFDLCPLGDIAVEIDGVPLDFAGCLTWRGVMFEGVPNMALVFGYLRASWTLRADLVSGFVCRLLDEMAARQARVVRVAPPVPPKAVRPWIDPADFNPGYVMRGLHLLPRADADDPEWSHTQDYPRDKVDFPAVGFDAPAFRFA